MQSYYDDYDKALRYVRHKLDVFRWAEKIILLESDESFFSNTETMDNFPWDDIAYSMIKFHENTFLDYDICPKCGEKRIKLRFKAFDERVIPVNGEILICPFCRTHFGLKELIKIRMKPIIA